MTTSSTKNSALPAAQAPETTGAAKSIAAMPFDAGAGGMAPANFDDAWRMAQLFARSDLVPKDYRDRAENCLVAIQMGAELGLKPLQALQGIAVINGRPAVWGDALWALVQNSALVLDTYEDFDEATMTATCRILRRGRAEATVATFSQKDAVAAGLWSKTGPWSQYPRRMLQLRARAFAARDAVPDVLKGVAVAEELGDYTFDGEAREVVRPIGRIQPKRKELPSESSSEPEAPNAKP